jgi:hypothetical protein
MNGDLTALSACLFRSGAWKVVKPCQAAFSRRQPPERVGQRDNMELPKLTWKRTAIGLTILVLLQLVIIIFMGTKSTNSTINAQGDDAHITVDQSVHNSYKAALVAIESKSQATLAGSIVGCLAGCLIIGILCWYFIYLPKHRRALEADKPCVQCQMRTGFCPGTLTDMPTMQATAKL